MAIGEELGLQVNAKGAGKGKVSCVVVQPDGSEVEAEVVENDDGTFDIFYTAPEPGSYVIYVRFGGENVPRSPFKVTVSFASFGSPVGEHPANPRRQTEIWLCFSVSGLFGGKIKRGAMCGPSAPRSRCFHDLTSANKTDGTLCLCLFLIPASTALIFIHRQISS